MGRNLIVGDIHGQYSLLMEVLDKAAFSPCDDTLYTSGDLADRGRDSARVIRFLMSLPSCRPVLGNHDVWLESFLLDDARPPVWMESNGGRMTAASYIEERISKEEKAMHGSWVRSIPLCICTENYIVVHAGIPMGFDEDDLLHMSEVLRNRGDAMTPQEKDFMWDRGYISSAISYRDSGRIYNHNRLPLTTDKRIFVGHTPLPKPFISDRYHLAAVDTGAGHDGGHLTVMDMDTLEFWESSPAAL